VYNLTIATAGKVLRPRPSVSAPQALWDGHDEEGTGYQVTCHDENGDAVTKSQLREAVKRA
jgi:hypothetical protein